MVWNKLNIRSTLLTPCSIQAHHNDSVENLTSREPEHADCFHRVFERYCVDVIPENREFLYFLLFAIYLTLLSEAKRGVTNYIIERNGAGLPIFPTLDEHSATRQDVEMVIKSYFEHLWSKFSLYIVTNL
jgi:hypothetical protein